MVDIFAILAFSIYVTRQKVFPQNGGAFALFAGWRRSVDVGGGYKEKDTDRGEKDKYILCVILLYWN